MADAAPRVGVTESEWKAVRLTEARQVAALMGQHRDDWPSSELGVKTRYDQLRASGALAAAIKYLAHALPRLEAVAWAVRMLESDARATPLAPRARHALDVALRWLGDRTDAHRRAARDAGEAAGQAHAERALGLAIFYSGGSIATPRQSPTMPPEHVAARYVVAAISQAAHRGDDPDGFFIRALDLGETVAEQGLDALYRREAR